MDGKLLRDTVNRVVSEYRGTDVNARTVVWQEQRSITLATARELSAAVMKKADAMGVKAVVAVCDCGGNPILLERMDGAYIASCDIAQNKAFTSASLKMPTSELKGLAQPNEPLYGIQFTNSGRIVIFGGGEPLTDRRGEIVGGLGVSGGTEAQDTELGAFGRSFFEKMCG